MAEEEKILPVGESQETPQAITITIMDPSALENTALDSSLVSSVHAYSSSVENNSLLVVSNEGHGPKSILESVTETHMGTEDLPIISNISNPDHELPEQSSGEVETKLSETFGEGMEEAEEEENEPVGQHCLICNADMGMSDPEEQVPFFKTQTTATTRRLSIFFGSLIGQKLTSRKAHSDIICRRCFGLLDRVDTLEVEIRETKEELVNKYHETLSVHGGRARRRKPATAKKTDYVFPKIEPEDEDEQMLGLDTDGTFEPRLEDLMEEEHDRCEDANADDDEWEPEFKRPRIKREVIDTDTGLPPKRKRGRPRKDALKPKDGNSQLRLADEESGSVGEVTLPATSQSQKHSTHHPNNQQPPNFTSHEQLRSLALLLKVEDHVCDCGVKSSSKMAQMEHILTHVSSAFKCPKCECSFSTSSCLAQHQRLVHSPDTSWKRVSDMSRVVSTVEGEMCSKCGLSVGHDFEVHAENHLFGEFPCPVCALRLETKNSVETHIELMHPHLFSVFLKSSESSDDGSKNEKGSGSPVSCDVCGKVVATASRLARHHYLHHPEHYPWPCPTCFLCFHSEDAVNHHVCPQQCRGNKESTVGSQKLDCAICGISCKSKISLEKHILRLHPDRSRGTHICPVCARSLTSRKALTDHLRHHRRQGFPCEICGAKLKSMDSLNVHINELHTHVVRLQCKQCPQVFFSSGRLSYHIKRHHTDHRSYTNLCELCGRAYPYPSELRLHLRSHSNERPYKCNQCQKSFMKQGDLTYHKRSHTGERPHKCPHCDARFPRPNTLMSHIRNKHGQNNETDTLISTSPPTAQLPSAASPPVDYTPSGSVNTSATSQYVAGTGATVMAVSSTPYLAPVNPPATLQPRPPAVTVMSVPGATRPNNPTLVPMVESQTLVDSAVDGQVAEVQPVHYVQVEGLPAHTLQPLQPHQPQAQYTHTSTLPYQILHFQILQ